MPVSTPSDPQAAALLAHVLSQTQQNISFLAAQNYITPTEAAELITRLSQVPSNSHTPSADSLLSGVRDLTVGPARTPEPARRIPPPPPRNLQKARALWGYNEDGREPNDLSFSPDEIIEIVDETNVDWWTGKCRGKQGLFPSNHVQKIDSASSTASSPPPPPSGPPMSMMPSGPTQSYYSPPPGPPGPPGPPQPYGMPEKSGYYQPTYAPPPSAPVQAPPVQQVIVQEEPKKNSKFGGLGNTMAHSAAGGVGFGAGAAIGGGIINALF